MQKKRHDLIIGFFVLASFIVTGYLILRFGNVMQRHGRYYNLTVYFSDVGGLIQKAPVFYAGVEVGSVEAIRLPEPRFPKVRVTMRIREEVTLKKGDIVTISSRSLLGEKIMVIMPGDPSKPAYKPGDEFEGVDPVDITATLYKVAEPFISDQFQNDILDTVSGLREIVSDQNRQLFRDALINFYVASENILQDLESIRTWMDEDKKHALDTILMNIEAASSDLPELMKEITVLVKELRVFAERNSSEIEDLIGSLKQSSDHASSFIVSLRGMLSEISKAQSTLGRLIYEDELYENLVSLIRGMRLYGLLNYQKILHEEERKRMEEGIWVR